MENRMFSEMGKAAVRRLCERNPEEIAGKAGIEICKNARLPDLAGAVPAAEETDKSCMILKSLGKPVAVFFPSGRISPELDGWHQLLLLHYLAQADGTPLSEDGMPFGSMKDGLIRGTRFDHASEKELAGILCGKEPEQIHFLLQKAGAEFMDGKADLCAVFRLFPRFPIYLNIWFADEEFPASGKFFVNKSADHYLTIEDAVTAGELLLRKMNMQWRLS